MIVRTLLLILCLAFSGCATKGTTVVLLEDPDGSVGQIEVSTPAGTQQLSAAGHSTRVSDASASPSALRTLDQKKIEQEYGQVLQAMPSPPENFLLYFEYGKAELTAESKPVPSLIIEAINRRNSRDVRVNGHSDTIGQREDNARLSLERAERARDILVGQGIDPSIMKVFSHGEGNLLIPTADDTPEPRNRRVEVLVR
ncbi:MAG: OmpA family protein [Desulfomicrobium apsheronum]|jgi:outer membrane protein OmpA-like peptidoglycan-associated protein|nr:OmpA family protein [Desulfomicrobium apsheronum]